MSEAAAETNESNNTDGTDSGQQLEIENDTSATTSSAGDDFKPITSQKELDQALKGRLDRERSKFKDYNDLKAKATKFDQVTAAQKSEVQLAIERAEAAERKASELESAKEVSDWKSQVAKDPKYAGVTADVLRGNTFEEIEGHAASLKALLPEPRKGGQVSTEGRTVSTGNGDPRTQFADLLKTARGG